MNVMLWSVVPVKIFCICHTGMYPGDPGAPGGDCAGVVTAVGPGKTHSIHASKICISQPSKHGNVLDAGWNVR